MGAERLQLVLEQLALRPRARRKFARAEQMYFTRKLLEQSTDESIARYKSARFPRDVCVADLCVGLGGDLLGLGERGPVVAVDLDPLAIRLARANCRACGLTQVDFVLADAATFPVDACVAWHIDPDRREQGRRSAQPDCGQPGPDVLQQLIARQSSASIKLAPAAIAPPSWQTEAELEWIGTRRECRQQVAWFGTLARQPGLHCAAVIDNRGHVATLCGSPDSEIPLADSLQPYVYEPHASVLAAHLTQELAGKYGLAAVAPGIAYLTGTQRIDSALVAGFAVLDVLPLDRKRLRAWLRTRRIGRLEIKVRGALVDPQALRQQLHVSGDGAVTLLIMGTPQRVSVIAADRLEAAARS